MILYTYLSCLAEHFVSLKQHLVVVRRPISSLHHDTVLEDGLHFLGQRVSYARFILWTISADSISRQHALSIRLAESSISSLSNNYGRALICVCMWSDGDASLDTCHLLHHLKFTPDLLYTTLVRTWMCSLESFYHFFYGPLLWYKIWISFWKNLQLNTFDFAFYLWKFACKTGCYLEPSLGSFDSVARG